MKVSVRSAFALLTLLLFPGCATHHLWTESRFAEKRAASMQPNLEIYKLQSVPSFLVVYDEWNPHGPVARRAYFLEGNDSRALASKKPKFVPVQIAQWGEPVPVLEKTPEPGTFTNSAWVLKISTFGFQIYDRERYVGRFDLPIYRDRANTTAQVLITPAALLADASLVGGALLLAAAVLELEYHPYHPCLSR